MENALGIFQNGSLSSLFAEHEGMLFYFWFSMWEAGRISGDKTCESYLEAQSTFNLLLTHFSVLPLCAGDSAPGKETWIAAPQSSKWVQEKPLLLSPLPQISLSGQVRQFPSFSHSTVESSSPRGTLRTGSGRISMVSPIEKARSPYPLATPFWDYSKLGTKNLGSLISLGLPSSVVSLSQDGSRTSSTSAPV